MEKEKEENKDVQKMNKFIRLFVFVGFMCVCNIKVYKVLGDSK